MFLSPYTPPSWPSHYVQTTNWRKLYIPWLDKEERRTLLSRHDFSLLSVPENYLMSEHILNHQTPHPVSRTRANKAPLPALGEVPDPGPSEAWLAWRAPKRTARTQALLASGVKIHSQCVIPPPAQLYNRLLCQVFFPPVHRHGCVCVCVERCGWFGLE